MDNCQSEDRLRDYDHFGLAALDLYAYVDDGKDDDDLGDRLNIDALREYDSSASSLLPTIVLIFAAIAAIF